MRRAGLNLLRLTAINGAGVAQQAASSTAAPSALLAAIARTEQSFAAGIAAAPALVRELSTSKATSFAQAATQVAVEGDVDGVLSSIDKLVTSDTASAKDVADAAVALAYLQAKGNRRIWGKVFEKASAVKGSFDAASLANFLWASTTAGVAHFKTTFELAGPAVKLVSSLSPSQLSFVVEGLGAGGAKDLELFSKVADQVSSNPGAYKPAELARILWGFAAAGVDDAKLTKAAAQALAGKAGDLSGREAAQAIWALARLRRADKAALDALVRTARSKVDNAVDAAGAAWGLGFIGYKDNEAGKALGAVLKAGAGDLSPAHAIDAAWGLAIVGGADKEAVSALFGAASKAIEAAPDSVDPYQAASLFEAAAGSDTKLSPSVSAYAAKMHALVEEGAKSKRSAGLSAFKSDLAEATARALGAKYRPEVSSAVSSYPKVTPGGVAIDIGVDVDGNKIAVEGVGAHYLSSAGTPLGPALSRARLLEAQGYKPVLVSFAEFAAAKDAKDKAKVVLSKIRASVPALAGKADTLSRNLDQPFDPYQ